MMIELQMADNVIKFNEFNDKELKIVGHHVLCVEPITVSLFHLDVNSR